MYPSAEGPDFGPVLDRPEVHELLQQGTAPAIGAPSPAAMPGGARPQVPAGANAAAPQDRVSQAMALIAPLFAVGAALGGSPQSGASFMGGYQHGRHLQQQQAEHAAALDLQRRQQARLEAEQTRIANAQVASAMALQHQRDEQRQRAMSSYVLDVAQRARQFGTKAEHDQFVNAADALAVENYGAKPGSVRGAVPFTPAPMRERAAKVLDRYKKLAPDGQLALGSQTGNRTARTVPLDQVMVDFDIDGDGKDERVSYRKLEELAGEAIYTADGQRVVPDKAAPAGTYGDVFSQARGTVLEDKPMPVNARGVPDFGKAERDLRALRLLTDPADRRQARTDAQAQARDRLYNAILDGTDDKVLSQQFGGVFSGLGLSFRAEAAKIRQQIFSMGNAGLSPEDRALSTPADVMGRGRSILTGGNGAPPAPAAVPVGETRGGVDINLPAPPSTARAAAGRGAGPVTTPRNDFLVLRDQARAVLDAEAQRRGLPAGSITEDQIQAFLANPVNRRKLQGR